MLICAKNKLGAVKSGKCDFSLMRLYGADFEKRKKPLERLISRHRERFGDVGVLCVSVPDAFYSGIGIKNGFSFCSNPDVLAVISKRDDEKITLSLPYRKTETADTAELFANARGFDILTGGFDISASEKMTKEQFFALSTFALSYIYNDDGIAPGKLALCCDGLCDRDKVFFMLSGGFCRISTCENELPDAKRLIFEPEEAGLSVIMIDKKPPLCDNVGNDTYEKLCGLLYDGKIRDFCGVLSEYNRIGKEPYLCVGSHCAVIVQKQKRDAFTKSAGGFAVVPRSPGVSVI